MNRGTGEAEGLTTRCPRPIPGHPRAGSRSRRPWRGPPCRKCRCGLQGGIGGVWVLPMESKQGVAEVCPNASLGSHSAAAKEHRKGRCGWAASWSGGAHHFLTNPRTHPRTRHVKLRQDADPAVEGIVNQLFGLQSKNEQVQQDKRYSQACAHACLPACQRSLRGSHAVAREAAFKAASKPE